MAAKAQFQFQSVSGATFAVSPALVADIEALIDMPIAFEAAQRSASKGTFWRFRPISDRAAPLTAQCDPEEFFL